MTTWQLAAAGPGDPTIEILILSSDALSRAGLEALLSEDSDFVVLGTEPTGTGLLEAYDLYQPEVILCDLGGQETHFDGDGFQQVLEEIEELKALKVPVVVLVAQAEQVRSVWAAGVTGLLGRESSPGWLRIALRAAASGLAILDPGFQEQLSPFQAPGNPYQVETLSPREIQVLEGISKGFSNRAIAHRLEISEHTVKFHIRAIFEKLGVNSRTEAVVRATQAGFIHL